jgi:hypothetical protein
MTVMKASGSMTRMLSTDNPSAGIPWCQGRNPLNSLMLPIAIEMKTGMNIRPARYLCPVPGFRGGIPEFPVIPNKTGQKDMTAHPTIPDSVVLFPAARELRHYTSRYFCQFQPDFFQW